MASKTITTITGAGKVTVSACKVFKNGGMRIEKTVIQAPSKLSKPKAKAGAKTVAKSKAKAKK